MADMGWTARMASAAGTAAGIGAAQLGLGYGLGVVVWPTGSTDGNAWLGSLGWATWITASATVLGAVIAGRLGDPTARRPPDPWRLGLALCAGIGALASVALIAFPARLAVVADTVRPQVVAGSYALVGLALGVAVAYWAIASRPVALNVITTAVWLWALAIAATAVALTARRSSATYLTNWQFTDTTSGTNTIAWPSALLTMAAAGFIGLLAAIPAVRNGDLGVAAACSGAVGPLLVAVSYLALAPRLTGALGPLGSPYLIAPYAMMAGIGGSALTVSIGQVIVSRQARLAADPPNYPPLAIDVGDSGLATTTTVAAPSTSGSADPAPSGAASGSPGAPRPRTEARPGPRTALGPETEAIPGTGATPRSEATPGSEAAAGTGATPGPEATPGSGAESRPRATPRATAINPAKAQKPPERATDRDVAEAVRPTRSRAKKAAPTARTVPTSRVTPPPANPPVARINPEPPTPD